MYNKKTLSKATAELDKAKAPKKPKDIITDSMGQWKYPGLPTRIPSNNITMKGVGYPVLGVANNGQRKIMLPGADYTFPGAEYVDEYPQMKKGGTKKKRKTKSIMGVNKLMQKGPLFQDYSKRIYDPNVDYFQDGGFSLGMYASPEMGNTIEPSLNYDNGNFSASASSNLPVGSLKDFSKNLNLSARYKKDLGKLGDIEVSGNRSFYEGEKPDYNMSVNYNKQFKNGLGINIKGDSPLKNIRNNGNASVGLTYTFQDGGFKTKLSKEEEKEFQKFYETLPENLQSDDPTYDIRGYWNSEGNPSTFNYDQPKEDDGYYHAYSVNQNTGEYLKSPAHPTFAHAVEEDKKMGYRPSFNIRSGKWESEEVSPEYEDGGYIEADLTDDEIENYRKAGYIVEDISVPELNQAKKGKTVKSKDGTITNTITKANGDTVIQVKNKNGEYYEKLIKKSDALDTLSKLQGAVKPEFQALGNAEAETKREEKQAKQKFLNKAWSNYDDWSTSDKVSDRVGAFLNDPFGMTARAVTGNQAYIPGMGQGLHNNENPEIRERYLKELGYTPGEFDASDVQNMINPGYWATSLVENSRKGNLDEAALDAGLMFLPHLPKGTISKSNIKSGVNLLKNDVKNVVNPVAGLKAPKGINQYIKGSKVVRNQAKNFKDKFSHLKDIKTVRALGESDPTIAKQMFDEYYDPTFGKSFNDSKDFRLSLKKSNRDLRQIKAQDPSFSFENPTSESDIYKLNRKNGVIDFNKKQTADKISLANKKKHHQYVEKKYLQNKDIVSQHPVFSKIAEESPQYLDIIAEQIKNPNPYISDESFLNSLVHKSNTFHRAMRSAPQTDDLLKVSGKSMSEGKNFTADVEGMRKSDDYGNNFYEYTPSEARMEQVRNAPMEEKWGLRIPQFENDMSLNEGVWSGISPELYNAEKLNNQRYTNRVGRGVLAPHKTSSQGLLTKSEILPKKYVNYPKHMVFSSPTRDAQITGFDVRKVPYFKGNDLPGTSYGFKEGGVVVELTPEEIEDHITQGYIVEDISIPELNQAQEGIIQISDPKEFAYREKKYNDSLTAYNYGQKKLEKRNQLNKKYKLKENPANKWSASDKNTLVQKLVQKRTINDVAPIDLLFTDDFHTYYGDVNGKKNKDPNLLISMTNKESGIPIHGASQDYFDLMYTVPFYKKPTQKPVLKSKKNDYPVGYQPYSLYGKVLDPEVYGYAESLNGKPVQVAQFADTYGYKAKMDAYRKSGKYPWKKMGGLVEAQKGGESKVILSKEHTDKKGNKTIVVTKDDGTKYTKVISKDGKVYNNTQAGLSPEMRAYGKKKAEWEDRSSGAAQPVDDFWTLPIGMSSAGVKGTIGLVKGLTSLGRNAVKSSLVQSGKAGVKQLMNAAPKSLPGANLKNLLNSAFIASGITEQMDKNSDVRKATKKAYNDPTLGNIGDAVGENILNLLNFSGADVGKSIKQLGKYAKTKIPLANVQKTFPEAGSLWETVKSNIKKFDPDVAEVNRKLKEYSKFPGVKIKKKAFNAMNEAEQKEVIADFYNNVSPEIKKQLELKLERLGTEKGFNLLKNQEKEYLESINVKPEYLDELSEKAAKSRVEELNDILTNRSWRIENADNAYHWPKTSFDNEVSPQFIKDFTRGSADEKIIDEIGDLPLDELTPELYTKFKLAKAPKKKYHSIYPEKGTSVSFGTNHMDPRTMVHELTHSQGANRTLPIETRLREIAQPYSLNMLKGDLSLDPVLQKNYDYFRKTFSNSSRNTAEPLSFGNEFKQVLLDNKLIKDWFEPLTEKKLLEAKQFFKKNPVGVYDPEKNEFHTATRILDFTHPTRFKMLAEELNKIAPVVKPVTIGAGSLYVGDKLLNKKSSLQQQKKGGIVADLTHAEIQDYIKQGYIVEDVD